MTVTKQDPLIPLHVDGVPLFFVDGASDTVPIVGDVEPLLQDWIYVYIERGDGTVSNWGNTWWAGFALGDTEFKRVLWPVGGAYDPSGNLVSGASSAGFTEGSNRFDIPILDYRVSFDAILGRPHQMRIYLNPLVGYHKNDVKIRLVNMWYAPDDETYDDYSDPTDPATSFTVSAFRSSSFYPSIPVDAVTLSGTAPFSELITNLDAPTSTHDIATIHWNNSTDSITIS
jgi:hypothetical protein